MKILAILLVAISLLGCSDTERDLAQCRLDHPEKEADCMVAKGYKLNFASGCARFHALMKECFEKSWLSF